jgi:drug/metabolite transporter (DMT)-like permease
MTTAASPTPRPSAGLTAQDAAMLTVCLIWGGNFTVMKLALERMEPLAFTAVRFVLGSVLLWAVLRWKEGPAPLPRGSFLELLGLGVVGNTLYQLAFVVALDRSTATNTALIISAVPAVVAVLGGIFGIERTTARMRWGIALGMTGVAMVVLARGGGVSFGAATIVGDLLALAATLCWSVYTLALRRLPPEISPLRVTAWTTYTGTPGLVLAGLPQLAAVDDWGALGWEPWAAIAYATGLSLVLAYLLWNTSVRVVGGSRTAIYMCVTPLVAALVAWMVLGERPGPLHAAGAVLIIGGVLLTRLGGAKRVDEPEPVPAEG